MGESNGNGSGNSKMYTVVGGKWTRRCSEDTPNSVKRINKNDVEVCEVHFSQITNYLFKSMEYKTLPFGRVVDFQIQEAETLENASVSFTTNDQHLLTLCKMLPNIDPQKPIDLILALDKEKTAKKGKECHSLLVKQDGEWIKHHYKRDVNGLPAFKERRDGSLDSSDHDDFLLGVLEEWALSLDGISGAQVDSPSADCPDEEDSVPF